MKTRSRPYHRTIDPGVDNDGGGVDVGDVDLGGIDPAQVGQVLTFYRTLKETFDGDSEDQEEARRIIDLAIEVLLRIVPLGEDRPGSVDGGGSGPLGY